MTISTPPRLRMKTHFRVLCAILCVLCIGTVQAATAPCEAVRPLLGDFLSPPDSARPWCYYIWLNGHADRETITADLESMKRLGFGGINLLDTRGYWDNDDDHVIVPAAEIAWGSPAWYDLVEFCVRECARLGIAFTMNAGASGGTLRSFVDGKPRDADVLDPSDVAAHLDRAVGPLLDRVPDLVGRTFTHIYTPSYEGTSGNGGRWSEIRDAFYATMHEWARGHGLKVYSESGGPWGVKGVKLDCDQLDLMAFDDFPMGEFWARPERHAKGDSPYQKERRFFVRAAVLAARRHGRRIVALEAFTHTNRHYSSDPAFLKPFADAAFADGANRLVWHTFTCSPERFGIPGSEYFAGSHVNRNVTWHRDAEAFVEYLWRCQALLQRGEWIDDGEFVDDKARYHGWGRHRRNPDARFATTHRRERETNWFFVAGEGCGDVDLNASCEGRTVEIWDAVTATRKAAQFVSTPDGKTRVVLDLPEGGSCFVVFAPGECVATPRDATPDAETPPLEIPVTNSWHVSFAFMDGVSAPPPEPVEMQSLCDWTALGEKGAASGTALRYFAGIATYRTTVMVHWGRGNRERGMENVRCVLRLGELPSGLARVLLNGIDCGVVWCAPWEADVSSAVREGENEIVVRYTNNWFNRLVGDCFLRPEERVTHSTLHYWPRSAQNGNALAAGMAPSRKKACSGPSADDLLQPSGLLGPVQLMVFQGD